MAYHREDEVARLITNLERWIGDSPIQGAGRLWNEEQIAMRDLKLEYRSNFGRFEALGVEAQLTKDALGQMVGPLRFALRTYHTSSLTFEMQARQIVGVSKSTYHVRLVRAHVDFIDAFEEQQQVARDRAAAYVRIVNAS